MKGMTNWPPLHAGNPWLHRFSPTRSRNDRYCDSSRTGAAFLPVLTDKVSQLLPTHIDTQVGTVSTGSHRQGLATSWTAMAHTPTCFYRFSPTRSRDCHDNGCLTVITCFYRFSPTRSRDFLPQEVVQIYGLTKFLPVLTDKVSRLEESLQEDPSESFYRFSPTRSRDRPRF